MPEKWDRPEGRKGLDMKTTEKELLFLAAMGACHESTFCEEQKDFKRAKRFNELLRAIVDADSFKDLIENPT